jgi:ferredoxin--NADP+ reductase
MYEIISKETLNGQVEKMVIKAPYVARKCEPGQFIIVRVEEKSERIPLTIADYDRETQTVTIIYQIVGDGTKALAKKEVGEFVLDFVGPLGQATELHNQKRVLGIAGGVGAAPIYPQLKKLNEMGVAIDLIIGGRTSEFIILEDEFNKICENVYFATNDGSKGTEGFVTDVLNDLLARGEVYDEVKTIGPVIMMKAVVAITKPINLKTNVSLNPIMVDGTGMCGGCRVSIDGETKFACVDGPDFDGFTVDFEELMRRQMYYKNEEKHICRMDSMENVESMDNKK